MRSAVLDGDRRDELFDHARRGDRLRHRVEQQVDAGASGRQCHDGHAELSVATDLGDDRSAVVRRLTQRALDDAGAEERGDPALWSVGTRRLVHATADVPHTTDEADVLDGEEADAAATAVASTSCRKPHGSIVARWSAEADQPATADAGQLEVAIRRAVRQGGGQPQLIEGEAHGAVTTSATMPAKHMVRLT